MKKDSLKALEPYRRAAVMYTIGYNGVQIFARDF